MVKCDYFDQDNNIQSGGRVMPAEPLQPKPPKSKIDLAQVIIYTNEVL